MLSDNAAGINTAEVSRYLHACMADERLAHGSLLHGCLPHARLLHGSDVQAEMLHTRIAVDQFSTGAECF